MAMILGIYNTHACIRTIRRYLLINITMETGDPLANHSTGVWAQSLSGKFIINSRMEIEMLYEF